jgi:hypothetical protein
MRLSPFWASENNIYLLSTETEMMPSLSEDGQWTDLGSTWLSLGSKIWRYSLSSGTWSSDTAVQGASGSAVSEMLSQSAFAWDGRTGYMYGGLNYEGEWPYDTGKEA